MIQKIIVLKIQVEKQSPFKSRSRYGSQISKPDFGKPNAGRESFINKNNVSVNRSIHRSTNRRSRNLGTNRSRTPGKSRGQLVDKNKRGLISKDQYKTREDLKKLEDEIKKPVNKLDDSYERRRNRDNSMDYSPYESKKRDNYDSYTKARSPSNEKRRQPYETREKEKIELGNYDSFSNAGSRDYNSPEIMKKKANINEPIKLTNQRKSYEDDEEKPKENRPYSVFDRRDNYQNESEISKNNFVESKNVSKAPLGENNLENDLMVITLKMIIMNQKKKIGELEDDNYQLKADKDDKDKKIRDLEEKIDDLETMGKLKDFTGDNTVDVPHLDEKLKNIDEYLDGIKYNPEQNKLIEDIIKKNQEYNEISKENANAMTKLRNNISNLKSTLNTLNVGD